MRRLDKHTMLLGLLSLKGGDKTMETLKLLIIIGGKTLRAEVVCTLELNV
jgi:hypothetical protein